MQSIFAKYDYYDVFCLANREDFLASLEKQYLIKTPHSSAYGCHLPPPGKADLESANIAFYSMFAYGLKEHTIDFLTSICYNIFINPTE